MSVSWVIPTVEGREPLLERSLQYPTNHELEVLLFHDRPTCGDAWVEGARSASGEYIYFAADDIEAQDGFLDVMIETVDEGFHPAATVMLPNGAKQSCGGMGPDVCRGDCVDWQHCDWSPTPFIRREWWELLEPHAEKLASLHYSSDCLVSAILASHGIHSVVRRKAVIVHHNAEAGRLWTAGTDHQEFLEYAGRL